MRETKERTEAMYRCCGMQDTPFCPETKGKTCDLRIRHGFDPDGGNEKKIMEIHRRNREIPPHGRYG